MLNSARLYGTGSGGGQVASLGATGPTTGQRAGCFRKRDRFLVLVAGIHASGLKRTLWRQDIRDPSRLPAVLLPGEGPSGPEVISALIQYVEAANLRRGGRVAEGGGLLNRYRG